MSSTTALEGRPPAEVRVSIAKLPSLDARTELFGRRDDTAWLDACWDEGANVASIIAFGGVGKSALVWDWLLRRMAKEGWRGAERVYGWSFYSQGTTVGCKTLRALGGLRAVILRAVA